MSEEETTKESAVLWMGDINPEMDKDFVIEAFANMGFTAIDVKEMHNRNGERANYCFVDFGDVNVAREVLIKVDKEPIPGTDEKKFRLNRSEFGKGGAGVEKEFSLYVREISLEVTDEELQTFFQKKYSSVRAANIVRDVMGNSRGFGFVRFFNEEQFSRALRQMNGAKGLGQKALHVNVASKGSGNKNKGAGGDHMPTDPSKMPKWMHQQMEYIQQMHQYMQQCHQFAQQAAAYAGWNQHHPPPSEPPPSSSKKDSKTKEEDEDGEITDEKTFINMVEKEHAKMISETTELEEDQELVDFDEPVDVAALNQAIIDRDDKFFFELEASKWDFETSFLKAQEQLRSR